MRRLLSVVYGCVVGLRGLLYDLGVFKAYHSRIPVISVGNITAGGNGKTPLCLSIAYEMRKRGDSPAILSRGYGGVIRGPHRVLCSDSCRDVGDEAVLMAGADLPVFVARRRVAGIKLIESDPTIDLVILDDGFQHRALARCLDIVSIFVGSTRAIEEFVAGRLLPAGMFREARDRALRRAGLVVLSYRSVQDSGKLGDIDRRIAGLIPETKPVFRSFLKPLAVTGLSNGSSVSPQPICALAAIANPEGFFDSLEALGFEIAQRFVFPDHYQFKNEDLVRVLGERPQHLFVCTSKDAVKLREFPEDIKSRFAVLYVAAEILPSDAFFVQIERAIDGHKRALQLTKVS
jgi:tetraacyldisaccharide 4'-kinase